MQKCDEPGELDCVVERDRMVQMEPGSMHPVFARQGAGVQRVSADPVVVAGRVAPFDGVGIVNNTLEDLKGKPRACETQI